ncbi:MAG: 16S rRNA (cytidine(1402)-2'-O)-methyltransferase [Myxococcales bacterium]|nr:16S rRNA (cytidine(1402)-2'-O)-methyltransferase [Myxococcales bacterium]MCB9644495.1 16S rRNA (cytidine(1402)-2'-O)-methyltransferase [Myxococcales bacterium]
MLNLSLPPFEDLQAGIYLVPTPIGNLDDITLRALRTLASVDRIAAEDTRSAKILLGHFGLHKPLTSLHRDNEAQRSQDILAACKRGERFAYISEAGMPGISDPGYVLVRDAIQENVPVIALPGPSAALTALVASGLPSDRFLFLGFLPHAASKRRQALAFFVYQPLSLILYVSPHRVFEELQDLQEILGDRKATLAREISKFHEEYMRGTLSSIHQDLAQRTHKLGEMVLIIHGADDERAAQAHAILHTQLNPPTPNQDTQTPLTPLDPETAMQLDAQRLLELDAPLSQLAKQLAQRWPHITRKQAYDILQNLRADD